MSHLDPPVVRQNPQEPRARDIRLPEVPRDTRNPRHSSLPPLACSPQQTSARLTNRPKPENSDLFHFGFPSSCWTGPSSNSGLAPFSIWPSWSAKNLRFLFTFLWTYPKPLIPFENSLSAILDLLRFVSASLQTMCVRQSRNGCLSVDDISIAANRHCWDLVSREHWKYLNCHIKSIPSQLPPTMVHAGICGKDSLHFSHFFSCHTDRYVLLMKLDLISLRCLY